MKGSANTLQPLRDAKTAWLRYVLIILVSEKIIQHTLVTAAFYFTWGNMASTVAVNPSTLMILGAIVAILFILSLWGLINRQKWAVNLIIALAVFDIIGEFVAQGTIIIAITVSFLVATTLLILALLYRRREAKGAA